MKLFRLRPVVVKAVQVTGFNHDEVRSFVGTERYRIVEHPPHGRGYRGRRAGGGWAPEPDGVVSYVFHSRYDAWLPCRVGDWIEAGPEDMYTPVRPQHTAARYAPLVG